MAELLTGYRADLGVRDELLDESGAIRPHWRGFLERFAAIGTGAREQITTALTEQIVDSGIAFNVEADPRDRRYSWRLDPMPVIVTAREWEALARGVSQRARLINAALIDIYGPQKLIANGTLPPALIFGNRGYIQAARNWAKPAKFPLTHYACDVARTADGGWQVLADQVETPAGHGWLLASRMSQANALGDLYLKSGVQRVSGFFAAMKNLYAAQAGDNGRIAVLSPGSSSASYFSHSYLARYLGFPVVESADLSFRDGNLHVKTLEGLMRVNLLIRKIHSTMLDSLSIPGTGFLGTPGLTQAARTGRVLLANAIGAGVLQNRVLASCSASLCEQLLGEPLALPENPALWLGNQANQEQVRHDQSWRINPLIAQNDPGLGSAEAKQAPNLDRYGYRWTAEQAATLPTTPQLDGDQLKPVPWAVRVFVCLNAEGDYQALPGGLVRLSRQPSSFGLPNGFGSKDLWVLHDDHETVPRASTNVAAQTAPISLRRSGKDLLSRTAESLFWLGRYVERTEAVLRTLNTVVSRILDDGGGSSRNILLHKLLAVHLLAAKGADEDTNPGEPTQLIKALIQDTSQTYALANSFAGIARNAALTRGILSQDGFRVLRVLHADVRWQVAAQRIDQVVPATLINQSLQRLSAFTGTIADNMTRNDAWQFLEMGRRLERAVQLCLLSRHLVTDDQDSEQSAALSAFLEIADSTMTYRSRYVALPRPAPAVDLLILDETNPRSLAFQLMVLNAAMEKLPNDGPYRKPEHRRVLATLTELRMNNAEALVKYGTDTPGENDEIPLIGLTQFIHDAMLEVSDLLTQTHFVMADTPTTSYSLKRAIQP